MTSKASDTASEHDDRRVRAARALLAAEGYPVDIIATLEYLDHPFWQKTIQGVDIVTAIYGVVPLQHQE